ncbi:DeoR/GlpR family DNA-binding transcription regulator [Bradyrhizobium sp. LHD-71]|uniref:DeoR/GlpR family DNA-binding transcription regulator n=1 Tax=Bradyrhizobium sp. LHD-71 TaxID=3072141 RepID=UPI00280CC2C6|nr:DeoR/GlpR family DNA-binding transcription regulator [Bradyrhizobium sp. LHD-71]MDQ8731861.1 DeoR/GlpR family DNA-binding transcription regulator [Bradyrhizobium sp. LHD-71]
MTKQDQTRGRDGARLSAARQQLILSLIGRGDIISVGDLAIRFGVSQETIRRDIRALEKAGGLRRVHGGAAPTGAVDLTARRPVTERLGVEREAKAIAAEAALPLFDAGMTVFLGGSSTMLLLAEALAQRGPALSVTTNMIDIATVLAGCGHCKVTLLGGVMKASTRTLVGPDTLRMLEHRLFDLAVCGTSAIGAMHGFLGPSEWHAAIGATLAERARLLAFVADASKFGRGDAYVVQPLHKVDALATDHVPESEMVASLNDAGVRLLLPQPEGARRAASS